MLPWPGAGSTVDADSGGERDCVLWRACE